MLLPITASVVIVVLTAAITFIALRADTFTTATHAGEPSSKPFDAAEVKGNLSRQSAREFTEFPVLSAGVSAEGHPLTRIDERTSPAIPASFPTQRRVGFSMVSFGYGTCTPPPEAEAGCLLPVTITSTSYCARPLEQTSTLLKRGATFSYRGAVAEWVATSLVLHFGETTVNINNNLPDWEAAAFRIADALVLENATALRQEPLGPGSVLGSIESQCAEDGSQIRAVEEGQISIELDCDLAQEGVQTLCDVTRDSSVLVGIVLRGAAGRSLAAFNFALQHADPSRLRAAVVGCMPPGLNCNPDFNSADVQGAGWTCSPIVVDLLEEVGDQSFISCINPADAPVVGDDLTLALVRYTVPGEAPNGGARVSLRDGAAFDSSGSEILVCSSADLPESCVGTEVHVNQ